MGKRRTSQGRKGLKIKLKKTTINSIASILLFALAALIWISFSRQGLLLYRFNSFLVDQLGLVPVLFTPFPLIVGGLMITKIKTSLSQPNVFVGSLVVLAALIGLVHQGSLGLELWSNLAVFISTPGTFLFLLAGLFVGGLIMFNVPFEDLLSFITKLAKPNTKSPIKLGVGGAIGVENKPLKISGMTGTPNFAAKPTEIKTTGLTNKSDPSKPSSISQPPLPSAASDQPWHYPPLSLLSENISGKADRGNVNANAAIIEKTLEAFGITAKVVEVNLGPAVTQYALEVAIGTKLSKISSLASDLALALAAPTGQIRIEAPIPGRSLVGIELPNRTPEFVSF
jgi:S-DNA-T family DNA segregation ATPase FtsK/SpoIIIE